MSDTNKKTKLSMLLLASLISTNLVFASNYKNNVVDVKLNKETNNAVKVTIFTDKPYTEPVVVNKKANNKYVILMPETKSSLKCSPSITNLAGTVSDISVNTQAIEGGKGYTKIVITSDKAITVVPRTQTSAVAPQAKPQVDTQKLAEEKAKISRLLSVILRVASIAISSIACIIGMSINFWAFLFGAIGLTVVCITSKRMGHTRQYFLNRYGASGGRTTVLRVIIKELMQIVGATLVLMIVVSMR